MYTSHACTCGPKENPYASSTHKLKCSTRSMGEEAQLKHVAETNRKSLHAQACKSGKNENPYASSMHKRRNCTENMQEQAQLKQVVETARNGSPRIGRHDENQNKQGQCEAKATERGIFQIDYNQHDLIRDLQPPEHHNHECNF